MAAVDALDQRRGDRARSAAAVCASWDGCSSRARVSPGAKRAGACRRPSERAARHDAGDAGRREACRRAAAEPDATRGPRRARPRSTRPRSARSCSSRKLPALVVGAREVDPRRQGFPGEARHVDRPRACRARCARFIAITRPSHSSWKTGSFGSGSTFPKPSIPPMSWTPSIRLRRPGAWGARCRSWSHA